MPFSTRELDGPAAVWEMYELASGIGIRNVKTGRAVARVPPGPNDLEAARLIEQAPQLLDALEELLAANVATPRWAAARLRAREIISKARG